MNFTMQTNQMVIAVEGARGPPAIQSGESRCFLYKAIITSLPKAVFVYSSFPKNVWLKELVKVISLPFLMMFQAESYYYYGSQHCSITGIDAFWPGDFIESFIYALPAFLFPIGIEIDFLSPGRDWQVLMLFGLCDFG